MEEDRKEAVVILTANTTPERLEELAKQHAAACKATVERVIDRMRPKTHLELIKQIFAEAGFYFTGDDINITVDQQGTEPGYAGFFVELEFDRAGNLVGIGGSE